jgi:hypothetical protein
MWVIVSLSQTEIRYCLFTLIKIKGKIIDGNDMEVGKIKETIIDGNDMEVG